MNRKWSNNATIAAVLGSLISAVVVSQTFHSFTVATLFAIVDWLTHRMVPAWLFAVVVVTAYVLGVVLLRCARRFKLQRDELRHDLKDCNNHRHELGQQLAQRKEQLPRLRVDTNFLTSCWESGALGVDRMVTVHVSAQLTYANPDKPVGEQLLITRIDVADSRPALVMQKPLEALNKVTTQLQSAIFTFRPNGAIPDGDWTLDTVFIDSENREYKIKLGPLRFAGDATQPPPAPPGMEPTPVTHKSDTLHPLSLELDPTISWWSPFSFRGRPCMLVRIRGTLTQTSGPHISRIESMHFEGTEAEEANPAPLLLQDGQPTSIDAKLIFYPSIGQPPRKFTGRLRVVDQNGMSWPIDITLRYSIHYSL